MAACISGSLEELRHRPILSVMECTISPLAQDGGSLEAALVGAAAGLPVGFMTMASCASTAPATMAGNLLVGNAEVLSALAMIELAYPGTPVFYAAAQTVMDLRSGAYTGGGPEDFLFGAASNELADFYNIPLSMGSFATGAKEPNWQAGMENSLSTFMASAVMSDMLLGVGLLNGSTIWSFEQMIMDCEIFGIVAKMMEGIQVNRETLALEAIRGAGPGGNFLTHEHTLRHLRELWMNTLLDRRPYTVWERKKDGARTWAKEKAKSILETHQPAPLESKLEAELRQMIQSIGKK
jgi:trimethylamine--corrinoid protein Co-methyltransferase